LAANSLNCFLLIHFSAFYQTLNLDFFWNIDNPNAVRTIFQFAFEQFYGFDDDNTLFCPADQDVNSLTYQRMNNVLENF
jgi:hypothetical protein